jgi:hypothetical protein
MAPRKKASSNQRDLVFHLVMGLTNLTIACGVLTTLVWIITH